MPEKTKPIDPQRPKRVACECGSGLAIDRDKKCQDCREQQWTHAQLLAVRGLGPGIIGRKMYEASRSYVVTTNAGVFGPALLGELPDAYKDDPEFVKEREGKRGAAR